MDPAAVLARSAEFPSEPGVYQFADDKGQVLYVGKAASLSDRVSQYARDDQGPRKAEMVRRAAGIAAFVTTNEREALILENTLIKKHRPPYNVMLTDDKTYPFIALTREAVPRIYKTRRRDEPDADVFGPFPSESAVKHLLRAVREGFGIRDCRQMLPQGCIKHELGLCIAPCMRDVKDEYARNAEATRRLLRGDPGPAVAVLTSHMEAASRDQDYEAAARWRDRIRGVQDVLERQGVFSNARRDRDAVAVASSGAVAYACVVNERQGRVIGKSLVRIVGDADDAAEAVERVLLGHYATVPPPPEVVLQRAGADTAVVEAVLSERRGARVRLHVPQRGALAHLVGIAEKNAQLACRETLLRRGDRATRPGMDELQRVLALEAPPRRIECIDVSHLQGREVVASLVTLADGRPDRAKYRHYKVSREANDDFAAMREVVTRRFTRLVAENATLPDLLVVDGGAGQVAAAREALAALTVEVPLIGLAKRLEEVYRPGRSIPLSIPRDSPALHVLQRARDEAHRFAVAYGQTLRRRRLERSPLDDVPGVGPVLKRRLLAAFGGLDGVRSAAADELVRVKGVGPALARRIHATLGRP